MHHLPPGMDPAEALRQLERERTLPAAWLRRLAATPDAPVVHSAATGWVTAGDLYRRAERKAGAMATAKPGDRVLISAVAGVDLIAVHIAALARGLIVVPANTAYTSAELMHVAEDSGATLSILDDPRRAPGIPHLDVAANGEPVDLAASLPRPEDGALLCYTSGTTGKPKGALLSHANLLASSESVRIAWRWTAADRLVLALPLFHMHGLGVGVHGTLLAGASMVLLPRFDAEAVVDAIAGHHATMFFGVPTMYARLAASPHVARLRDLRLCVSGSAPLPAELFERIEESTGQRVLERYGMTETCMNVSNPFDGERRPGTVGLPLPGVEVRIGAHNEIEVRGPSVFGGYWGQEALTEGFFGTGDVGEIDEAGYLRIVGRLKELIITGGFNVYPREVEEAIASHPCINEAAVVGVPDDEWGEKVTAFVVAGGPVTAADIDEHVKATLAPYKRPRAVHFVDVLPRNALGKVDRHALVARPPAQ